MGHFDTRSPSKARAQVAGLLRTALTVLLFAAAFCVVQRLTFTLRFPPYQRTTIWTPGSLFFSALLLTPPRRWWVMVVGLSLGVFAAYYGDDSIPVTSALLAVPFFCAAIGLGAWGVRRFGSDPLFGNLNSLVVFVLIAVVVVPLLTAAPVDVVRLISGADDAWPVFVRDLLCVALGTLIATPALTLTVANGRAWMARNSWKQYGEVAVLAAGLLAVGHVAFARPATEVALPVLLFAPLPLLLWAAVRFELAGVSWALLVIAFQSTWGAVHGRGPFASQPPAESVLQLQLFLLAISLPLMFLATVIRERGQAFAALSQAEQELRGQYAQLATIYHSAPVGLAFVDTQMRYVSINDYLAEINGLPADAHLGRPVRQVLPQHADTLEPIYRRVMQTGQAVVDVEIHGPMPLPSDDERSWLVSHYPVTDLQGTVLGVSTVVQEITERRRAEEARHELTHASRLAVIGELTASIAHEINQPLGAILSNADAAEMLLEAPNAPLDEVRQILDDIRKDDLRASEVIRRVRSLVRNRAMEMQPVDLTEVVSEVVWLMRAEARRRGVAVKTELLEGLPLVRGDRVHLQQVMLNLFLNGIEAMTDVAGEKRLTVSTAWKENDGAEVAVSDTGPGVQPDRLAKLFAPFFSTKKEGMGLGLSISRSLVEGHGGRIWAENNPGGGATFRFALPADHSQPIAESPDTQQAPLGACT